MVRTQQPSVVGKYSVPQPDITVVVQRGDYHVDAHPEPRDVLLAVEVADSTLRFDRNEKNGFREPTERTSLLSAHRRFYRDGNRMMSAGFSAEPAAAAVRPLVVRGQLSAVGHWRSGL